MVSNKAMVNLWRALIAVLVGNAAYFLLMPHLPPAARHTPFRLDLGLAVDFWFCLVVFGIIRTFAGWKKGANEK